MLLSRSADREVAAKHPSVTVLLLFLMQTTALETLLRLQVVSDKLSAASMKVNPEKCGVFHKE